MPVIEELMGGPICFGEIGLRYMGPYDGPIHLRWHRDRPHWLQHPLRMDYLQLMVYLTDVDESTHCISFSPESVDGPILENEKAQLARGGVYDLHGLPGPARCSIWRRCTQPRPGPPAPSARRFRSITGTAIARRCPTTRAYPLHSGGITRTLRRGHSMAF